MNTAALEASNLTVNRDGRRILDVPSFRVTGGEVLAVIGPNGSGKTTLLQCLALLLKPDSGEISFGGLRVFGGRSVLNQRRRLAVVFQEPLLLRGTVRDNVTLGLRLRSFNSNEMAPRVNRWLERFGIAGLAGRQTATLSGGEAQRASLARAFALEPDVMFLDEPFAALDTPTRQTLTAELSYILRETRTTTVMVTHDRNEALALSDRVAVIISGQIRQIGKPHKVFANPADEKVAVFVGVENIIPGVVLTQRGGVAVVSVAGGRTIDAVSDLATGIRVSACLRPEDITLTVIEATQPASSARNRLLCRVAGLSSSGAQTRVNLDCGPSLVALITTRSCQDLELAPGKEVIASFKASSVHLIPQK